MFQNNNLSIDHFLTVGAAGVSVASFTQIRSALISRYKSIYGFDIDLSTGSADGVFVNDLALIINNILQTVGMLYSNLDVNTASGIYLDALCNLANVTRKPATYSNASIQVTNDGDVTLSLTDPLFVDQAGTEWKYTGELTLDPDETKEVTVVCTVLGPIEAPAGWINQTVELLNVTVEQEAAANVGSYEESDAQLRYRRSQSSGANGTTVLESLSGALLGVSGLKDTYIYNNNTSANITAKDTTTVIPHSVYVIVRKEDGVTIEDSTIGSLIHEKITPGILTCASTAVNTNGTPKTFTYVSEQFSQLIVDSGQDIYWKQAIGIHPQIQIELTPKEYFTTDEFEKIANTIMTYFNELPISTDLAENDVLIEAVYADPMFRGLRTYDVGTITLASTTNPDTYYDYSTYTYTYNQGQNKYTLKIN